MTQPGLGLGAGGGGGGVEAYTDPGTDYELSKIGYDVLRAGGYRLSEAQERAIRTAIAGLRVRPLLDGASTDAMA
jgi:hypothetical protein